MDERFGSDDARRILERAQRLDEELGLSRDEVTEPVGVSLDALAEAAAEVGIHPDTVRDAAALERLDDALPERRRFDSLVGGDTIVADAVVHRDVASTLADVEAWLTTAHRMRCVRTGNGLVARPRGGVSASLGRLVDGVTGEVSVRAVDEIRVHVHGLHAGARPDARRTHVRLVADRSSTRRRRLGTGSGAVVGGAGAAAAGLATTSPVLAVIALSVASGGYVRLRSGAVHADAVELELLRIVDAVERGDAPVGLIGRAARRARSAVADRRR